MSKHTPEPWSCEMDITGTDWLVTCKKNGNVNHLGQRVLDAPALRGSGRAPVPYSPMGREHR